MEVKPEWKWNQNEGRQEWSRIRSGNRIENKKDRYSL